ncbi:unnamed protein product [Prunus armeniaca]
MAIIPVGSGSHRVSRPNGGVFRGKLGPGTGIPEFAKSPTGDGIVIPIPEPSPINMGGTSSTGTGTGMKSGDGDDIAISGP